MNFFHNRDVDRPERKGHGAKVPGSEMASDKTRFPYWNTRYPDCVRNIHVVNGRVTGQLADCQLADWTTRGLDISRTGQLAD